MKAVGKLRPWGRTNSSPSTSTLSKDKGEPDRRHSPARALERPSIEEEEEDSDSEQVQLAEARQQQEEQEAAAEQQARALDLQRRREALHRLSAASAQYAAQLAKRKPLPFSAELPLELVPAPSTSSADLDDEQQQPPQGAQGGGVRGAASSAAAAYRSWARKVGVPTNSDLVAAASAAGARVGLGSNTSGTNGAEAQPTPLESLGIAMLHASQLLSFADSPRNARSSAEGQVGGEGTPDAAEAHAALLAQVGGAYLRLAALQEAFSAEAWGLAQGASKAHAQGENQSPRQGQGQGQGQGPSYLSQLTKSTYGVESELKASKRVRKAHKSLHEAEERCRKLEEKKLSAAAAGAVPDAEGEDAVVDGKESKAARKGEKDRKALEKKAEDAAEELEKARAEL